MTGSDFKTSSVLKEVSENSILTSRDKHLVGLAVTLTRGCDACTKRRFQEAMESGISEKELIDLTDIVALTNAGVVIRTALLSVDENKSKNDCKDDVCTTH